MRVRLDRFQTSVTPRTADQLLSEIPLFLKSDTQTLILSHNLHSLYLNLTDEDFRLLYEAAEVVLVDGFPVLLAAKLQAGRNAALKSTHRIGSLDWVPRIGEIPSVRRVALVGSTETSNAGAVERLRTTFPRLQILGLHGEGWESARAKEVCARLNKFDPDITLVGLGMPLQERFLREYVGSMPKGIYVAVGGVIDQISGAQSPAPRWLGRYRLEWLWRLCSQPRRLSYRYLIEPWKLLALLALRARKSRS